MANKVEHSFEVDITEMNDQNVKEKILPYINELVEILLNNKCEDVRIITKIRKISTRGASVYIKLEDI